MVTERLLRREGDLVEFRTLGNTGLRVSVLGFGCGGVGGLMVRGSRLERERVVGRALDLGINVFDTAPSYGDGESEVNLGQALKSLKSNVYVTTKVMVTEEEMHAIPQAIVRSVEASLTRLSRDAIDLLHVHNHVLLGRPLRPQTITKSDVLEKVLPALERLRVEGRVRFIGFTGLGDSDAVCEMVDTGAFDTVQACFNMLNPSAQIRLPSGYPAQDFRGLFAHAESLGMGIIAIMPLAAGALTGVSQRHPLAAATVVPLGTGPDYATDVLRASAFSPLVTEGHVESVVEAALRFPLNVPSVASALVGFSCLKHLDDAVMYASRGALSEGALNHLRSIWSELASGIMSPMSAPRS